MEIFSNQLSDSIGVHYADITPISTQAKIQPDLIAEDGLHPSGIMYEQWTDQILPIILPEIKNRVNN